MNTRQGRHHLLVLVSACLSALACLQMPAIAAQIVVVQNGGGPPRLIHGGGNEQNADGSDSLDPIAMAVADVERGKRNILKVLPKLDKAIVPALERLYLSSLHVDEDDALLMVARLGNDNYFTREQASQALIHVRADLSGPLDRALEKTTDPEVAWRLVEIRDLRKQRGQNPDDVVDEALQVVYANWFDDLLAERAKRLLNDPLDEPAALFFARADSDKLVAGIAKRPPLEQARLLLSMARLHTGEKPALRALGAIDRAVLVQAARQSGWSQELPLAEDSPDTVLYESIDGNVLNNALFIPKTGKSIYPVSQAFCTFQIPVGPGNARVQVGAILRGRYELNLETGRIQAFTVRATLPTLPVGMLLPRLRWVTGMIDDWNTDVNRVPLWAKPFTPPEAVKSNWQFVLNAKHDLPEADAADQQLTSGVCAARMHKAAAAWLAAATHPAPPPLGEDELPRRLPADAEAVQNAAPGTLGQTLTILSQHPQPAWADAFTQIALSNQDGAGAAALEALFVTDPSRAGNLALRLSRVQWNLERARYAVTFLTRHFATTPAERNWDFEQRLTPPAALAAHAAAGK